MIDNEADLNVNSYRENDYFGDNCIVDAVNHFDYKSNSVSLCLFIDGFVFMESLVNRRKDLERVICTANVRDKGLTDIRKTAKKAHTYFSKFNQEMDAHEIKFRTQQSILTMFPHLNPSCILDMAEMDDEGGMRVYTTVVDELLDEDNQEPKTPLNAKERKIMNNLANFTSQRQGSSQKHILNPDLLNVLAPFNIELSPQVHNKEKSLLEVSNDLRKKHSPYFSNLRNGHSNSEIPAFLPSLEANPNSSNSIGPKLSPRRSPPQRTLEANEQDIISKPFPENHSLHVSEHLVRFDPFNDENKDQAIDEEHQDENYKSEGVNAESDDVKAHNRSISAKHCQKIVSKEMNMPCLPGSKSSTLEKKKKSKQLTRALICQISWHL